MIDREKVIKGLECCMSEHICRGCSYKINDECEDGGYFYSKAIEDALTLLKEQEAVRPRYIDGKWNHFTKCGKCNTDLMSGMKYCPRCGRMIKWDD